MYGAVLTCHFLKEIIYTRLASSIHQREAKVKEARLKAFVYNDFARYPNRRFRTGPVSLKLEADFILT